MWQVPMMKLLMFGSSYKKRKTKKQPNKFLIKIESQELQLLTGK